MTFRRALLILVGALFLLAVIGFFVPPIEQKLPDNLLEILAIFGAIIAFLPSLKDSAEFIQSLFSREEPALDPREYDLNSPQALRHRENLLNYVESVWIEGQHAFLAHAIHHQVMIELGLHYNQQAVDNDMPLNRVLLQAQRARTPIPASQTIADVYRTHGRSLLILGAPGSGKTIMLLRLAKVLLAEAVADENAPAPVIVPLASWANQRLPLIDWLAEEMFLQYQIGRKLSRQWLQDSRLVLLLDGLDEVAVAHRATCVSAINTFRDEYACEMVVSSRSEDYAQLAETLRLNTAVELQPLTLPEMHGYLIRFGLEMEPVRHMLHHDEEFRKLAQTPLMLTLFPLAYGQNSTNIPTTGTQTTRRQHLFHTYLQSTLKRRPLQAAYPLKNALHWLRNLAYLMTTHDQTPFYIENMQPTWLSSQRAYRWGLRLAVFLISTIVSGLSVGLSNGLLYGLIFGLSVGFGFVGKLFWEPLPVSHRLHFLKPLRGGLILGLIFGLIVGLIDWLFFGLFNTPMPFLILGLIIGLITALITALNGLLDASKIMLTELLRQQYSRRHIWQVLKTKMQQGLIVGLIGGPIVVIIGLIVGPIVGENNSVLSIWLIIGRKIGPIVGLSSQLIAWMIEWLVAALIVGLSGGLIGGLIEGIMGETQSNSLSQKATPNQGILLSGRNGILMGFIGMIRDAIVLGGFFSLFFGLFGKNGDFVVGALFGGMLGVVIGFLGGFWDYGLAVVQHYIVRWLLRDKLPHPLRDRKLVAYLDGMVERLLLQRVGGGWRFIHRELQEYVAGLSDAQLDELAALVEGGEGG